MDEAVDQRSTIQFPQAEADAPLATAAHAALTAEASPRLLTIPMLVRDSFFGAVLFERPADRPFTAAEIDVLSAAVAALGPLLEERRQNDRWIGFKVIDAFGGVLRRLFGPGHATLKAVAAGIVIVAAALSFATGSYDVNAKAGLEGLVRRAVVAPLDGYIKSAPVRAGDQVGEGEVIAALDDGDLTLERLRWTTERQQRQIEYDRAFAARDRSALATTRAQIDEAEAQIKLVDEQLSRLQLKAPFDALITAGDLSQSIGAVVSRGTTLFELAPLDAYRVTLGVDQSQIGDVKLGQTGEALFAAVPDQAFPFLVDKITPVAEAREGRTVFRVEGKLTGAPERLRPGMDGVAKINVDRRLLIWIWARSFLDWAQIASWQWLR
jgi:multidrug efflux pump subunit AcrA (membrane-fusion protein)